MRINKWWLFLLFAGVLLSSCSKNDEVMEPINSTQNQNITWVNYTHKVNDNDKEVAYTLQYLSTAGVETILNHKGDFSVRLPVVVFQENGTTYAHTLLNILPVTTKGGEIIPLHSQLTISTDHNFIIAQAGQTTNDCGYDARKLEEQTPISWFSYKF